MYPDSPLARKEKERKEKGRLYPPFSELGGGAALSFPPPSHPSCEVEEAMVLKMLL